MKSALIDYLSPKGHVPIINFYIKNLENYFDTIHLNLKIKKDIINKKKVNFINFEKNFILRVWRLIKLFLFLKKNKINKVVMLSYEPIDLFFLGVFLNLNYFKIFIFEHDTLNQKKILRFSLIKFLSKRIVHVVFTPQSKKLLKKKFNRNSIIVNHPIIQINYFKENYIKKKIILIPTRHHFNIKLIYNFINKNSEFYFYILSKKSNIRKNLFRNFKKIKLIEFIKSEDINKITAIYLPLDEDIYRYRISAWLYNGLAYNKKIILEHNNLYKYEKKRFPNHIILNKNKGFIINNFKVKKKLNILKYNQILIKDFIKKIFGE